MWKESHLQGCKTGPTVVLPLPANRGLMRVGLFAKRFGAGKINIMHPHAIEEPSTTQSFIDRRKSDNGQGSSSFERRQFQDGSRSNRPEVNELAAAVDDYKIANRRRFITFEELYDVMASLVV